jgi:hypothetical protein
MTSLTGSAGEDFASILRALGYRMDRRPPLPPKPAVVEAAPANEAAPSETPVEATAEPAAEAVTSEAGSAVDATPAAEVAPEATAAVEQAVASSSTLLPQVDFAQPQSVSEAVSASVPAAGEITPETPEPAETAPAATEAAGEQGSAEASAETTGASDAVPVEAVAAPAEPELVEVWRPGGRSEERRPQRHDRHRNRRPERAAEGGQPAAAGEAASGEAVNPARISQLKALLPQPRARPRRKRARDGERIGMAGRVSTARGATSATGPNRVRTVGVTRAVTAAGATAIVADGKAVRRIGNMRRAPVRVIAIARSTPIRRSQSSQRSRNRCRPPARSSPSFGEASSGEACLRTRSGGT